MPCRTDGRAHLGLMLASVRRPHNNVYHRSDGSELLIASDGKQDKQNVIHVMYHILVGHFKNLVFHSFFVSIDN